VSAFLVAAREGHIDDDASSNHVTFAYQYTSCYTVAKIEERVLKCDVNEGGRSYYRMTVTGPLSVHNTFLTLRKY
jgi:hypothetical protein